MELEYCKVAANWNVFGFHIKLAYKLIEALIWQLLRMGKISKPREFQFLKLILV